MANIPAHIYILDTHAFRGSAIQTAIADSFTDFNCKLLDLRIDNILELETEAPGPDARSARPTLCIYVSGGKSLVHPDTLAGLATTREHFPGTAIAALCDECSRADIETAIQLGLSGIIPTYHPGSIVIAALRFILAGGHYFPHSFGEAIPAVPAPSYRVISTGVDHSRSVARPSDTVNVTDKHEVEDAGRERKSLTVRQSDVLEALKTGQSNKMIARQLNICEATVKIHVRQLMKKFNAENRTQVVVRANALQRDLASGESGTALDSISRAGAGRQAVVRRSDPPGLPVREGDLPNLLAGIGRQISLGA